MLNRKISEVFYHTRFTLQTYLFCIWKQKIVKKFLIFFNFIFNYFLPCFVLYFYSFFVLANTDIGIYVTKIIIILSSLKNTGRGLIPKFIIQFVYIWYLNNWTLKICLSFYQGLKNVSVLWLLYSIIFN